MTLGSVPLSSPIQEEIAKAKNFYQTFERRIFADKTIVDLLAKLEHAIAKSHEEMRTAGILEICRACEQKEGGSCCGAGLENRYSSWLLLINLLLGVGLPTRRYEPKSCLFLAHTGCLLKARHVICVNYLCAKITHQVDARKIATLRDREGEELNTLFLLHERVKRVMREWMNA